MYKMIVVDMDGTLLNDKKQVSDENRRALAKASQNGVKIVISTGRIFKSAQVYAKMIGIKTPIIASNGAYIREKDKDEVIYQKLMDKDKLYFIADTLQKAEMCPQLFTSDTIFTPELVYFSKNYSKWNKSLPPDERVNIQITKDLKDVIANNDVIKIVVGDKDSIKLRTVRKYLEDNLKLSIASSAEYNFEIMEDGTSKGNAVKYLAGLFKIKRDEIICAGDNENDLSMIEYAGLGIAMGNAVQLLKDKADYITLTNEEDGIAAFINKFVLKE